MQVGLLWFDDDPGRDVAAKALDAARRYRDKFGALPDTCYVSVAALPAEALVSLDGNGEAHMRLTPAKNILTHHFWVGVEERSEKSVGLDAQATAS